MGTCLKKKGIGMLWTLLIGSSMNEEKQDVVKNAVQEDMYKIIYLFHHIGNKQCTR